MERKVGKLFKKSNTELHKVFFQLLCYGGYQTRIADISLGFFSFINSYEI